MEKDWQHIGALLGRIFITTPSENLPFWNGHSNDLESDYESLEGHISTEDGDMTVFNKEDRQFYIFFSMATKVELFRKGDSLFIIDGLLSNHSLEGIQNIEISEKEKLPFTISVENNWLNIFDATLSGSEITNSKIEGLYSALSSDYNSYALLNLNNGLYSAYRIELSGELDGETGELFGIELRKEN